jgi:hypothetical protein
MDVLQILHLLSIILFLKPNREPRNNFLTGDGRREYIPQFLKKKSNEIGKRNVMICVLCRLNT